MDKKRDELGKLLVCLLVSRKGVSTIRDLERDYREAEGRSIPYREFGCLSSLDFFHSISNHVKIVPGAGTYYLQPVVSEKIKHVNELVCRQKSAKKGPSARNRFNRPSQCYPAVRPPRSFVPNTVQKEVAQILTSRPSGVNKDRIAQCLQKSNAIAGSVDLDNVDDYVSGMPHTAVASGGRVYPSQSLKLNNNMRRRNPQDIDGFEISTPNAAETREASTMNNNSRVYDCHPAGAEDGEEIYVDNEFDEEDKQLFLSTLYNSFTNDNDYWHRHFSGNGDDHRPRLTSAEFIHQAAFEQTQSLREENDEEVKAGNSGGAEEEEGVNEDCTFVSDDESIDIISPRMKLRLQQLIQKHPNGIWCANLPQAYLDEYKVRLDHEELGFASVSDLANKLKTIFRLHRSNRGDFMLYDATKDLPPSATRYESPLSDDWEDHYEDDDVDPFPLLTLTSQATQGLIPNNVMTHGESVGQERIPKLSDGSDCLEVYVADVYTPSLFWIHLRSKRLKLSQLMESMHEFYEQEGDNYMIPQVILEKGLNCVCIFENQWHRAIIKTVKPDGHVTLIFYDYGTTKTYPPEFVRFLTRQYTNLPAQAIACGLYNVKPVNGNVWTRGASSEFYNLVEDIPLIAMVVKVDTENNSMLVSLADTRGEQDLHINDWLVNHGLAEPGFMVRNRPSNFVFRYYVACKNYHCNKLKRTPRLDKEGKVNSEANPDDAERSESESGSSSTLKLKSANYIKSLMARHSKYHKENVNDSSSNVETKAANSQAKSNSVTQVSEWMKGSSSTDIHALQVINRSPETMSKNRFSKVLRYKSNLMNLKKDSIKYNGSKSDNDNGSTSTPSSCVEYCIQASGNDNLYKTSESEVQDCVKHEDTGKLKFFGTFRSFFGGHGDMEPIDWSKVRNEVQGVVDSDKGVKSETIAETPSSQLSKEAMERSEIRNYTDKCSGDLSKQSLHRKTVSDFGKVTVHKTLKKKILPAKDCFLNAVQCNKDHYYSAHGDMLWWSLNGNIQHKPGAITPLLRTRTKKLTESNSDLTKISVSTEMLKILRGEKFKSEADRAVPKDFCHPDLDFITQLKRVRILNASKIENIQISIPQNKMFREPSTSLNSSPLNISNPGQNINEDRKTRNSLSNTRFATVLQYMNKKKKQNETSISAQDLSTESLNISSDTNSPQISAANFGSLSLSNSSNHSEKKINLQKDFATLCKRQVHRTSEAEKDYIISQNQKSSDLHCSSKCTISRGSSLSPKNFQTVCDSVELSKYTTGKNVSEINELAEKLCLTSMEKEEKIPAVYTINVDSALTEDNCSDTADCNKADMPVSSLFDVSQEPSKTAEKIQNVSSRCKSSDSISELDSDDLSRSYSNSEIEILQVALQKSDVGLTRNIKSMSLDEENISTDREDPLANCTEDIQEQFTPNNAIVRSDDNKEIETDVSGNKSIVCVPCVNDLDSLSDSDDWDVNGEWKDFMKEKADFMSHVVQRLMLANDAAESAEIVEITDKTELDEVFDRDNLEHDQVVAPISEGKYCSIYNTSRDENNEPNDSISQRHSSRNLDLLKNTEGIKSIAQSEVMSDEKPSKHSTEKSSEKSSKPGSSSMSVETLNCSFEGNNFTVASKSDKIDKLINKPNHVESETEIAMRNQVLTTQGPISKSKSMHDMLKNFKSRRNLSRVRNDFEKLDDSLHGETNASAIWNSESHDNLESGRNTLTGNEKSEVTNARESLRQSEMSADYLNNSSSSGCSTGFRNGINGKNSRYVANNENHVSLAEETSISNDESQTSSDNVEFIEEQPRTPFLTILSQVKKQQLSVKSPINDFGVKKASQIDDNTVLEKDSTSNENSESNNGLSTSLLDKLWTMYSSKN